METLSLIINGLFIVVLSIYALVQVVDGNWHKAIVGFMYAEVIILGMQANEIIKLLTNTNV